MAALAGVAAAVALLATPVGLLEMLVASSGLSEAVPAAAPPLGVTARLMMAGFVGLLIAGAVAAVRDPRQAEDERDTDGRQQSAQGARQMGFAFSKLTALARGRATPTGVAEAPALRRADAHPDAPPPEICLLSDRFDIPSNHYPEYNGPESHPRNDRPPISTTLRDDFPSSFSLLEA